MNKVKNITYAIRSLLSTRSMLSAFVLVLAANFLRPGIQALDKHFKKRPIEIRRSLKDFDVSHLPSFRDNWSSSIDPTNDSSNYVGTDELTLIRFKKENQRVALFVTYYNDPNDKVPHTPDVCYRQGGAVVKKIANITLDTPELAPEYPQIKVRQVNFKMPAFEQVILFCFCVEGRLRYSREQVRLVMGTPGNRYTYFSKIEVTANYPTGSDDTEASETCKTLLREALVVLLREHFPDKKELKAH